MRHITRWDVPFYWHGWTLFPAWMTHYMPSNVRDEITCPFPFPNFNGATVEVWGWTGNFITHILRMYLPIHAGVEITLHVSMSVVWVCVCVCVGGVWGGVCGGVGCGVGCGVWGVGCGGGGCGVGNQSYENNPAGVVSISNNSAHFDILRITGPMFTFSGAIPALMLI